MNKSRKIIHRPRRVNPTCRSGRFRSDPHRISSEFDIFHKKPIGSDRVFVGFLSVGFRRGFRRNLTEPDEIRVGSGRISIVFRRIPTKSASESDRKESDKNSVGSDLPSVTWVFILLRTTQLLRISELANSPNVRYEIFFLPYIDYFQLRTISPDGQNREKILSYKILFPESSIPHCQDLLKNQS
jgi:hypothetical protein